MSDRDDLIQQRIKLVQGIASKVRHDCYVAFQKTRMPKYRRVDRPVTSEVIADHLTGAQPIAVYTVVGDQTSVAILDFDDHDHSFTWKEMVEAARPIVVLLVSKGFKPLTMISGGGAGLHVWLFWEHPQSAKLVKQFLHDLIKELGFKHGAGGVQKREVEVFPKNDRVKEGQYGNAIALPYSRSSVPLDANLQRLEWPDFVPPTIEELLSPDIADVYSSPETPAKKPKNSQPQTKTPNTGNDALPGDDEEVQAALKLIEADDYETWIKAGLALKQSLGDSSFDIWDEWSSKSANYDGTDACRKLWDSFNPDGTLTIGSIFHWAKERGWNGPSNPHVRRMNAAFAIHTSGKVTMIIEKLRAPDDLEVLRMVGKSALVDRLASEKVLLTSADDDSKRVPIVQYWMNHPLAAHVQRITFDPDKSPGQSGTNWNTWSGFSFQPEPGEWGLLEAHISEVIADGDHDQAEWLLNWMALAVQQPGLVIGTAPVLMGSPGTGKGVFANAFGQLWGRHFLTVTHATHVQGNFSGHFFGKRFVFVDEGMFGGDRSAAGIIKTRMTEPFTLFERKGVDAELVPNHLIFMVASNEESVVPADLADRRWQILRINEAYKENRQYFQAIATQLEHGGYSAMLYDLLRRDLSVGPDPRTTIKNEGLFEQALRASGPEIRYLFAVLDEGELPQQSAPGNGPGKSTIRALYEDMCNRNNRARYIPQNAFGQKMARIFPSMKKVQSGVFMERGATGYERRRSTRYEFPNIGTCRRQFETFVGLPVQWTFDELDWQDTLKDADSDPPF